MNIKKLLKILSKNLLILLIGAILGFASSIFYTIKIWLPTEGAETGLAVIATLPVMLILFSILGIIIGAPLALIIYHSIKLIKKFLKKNK